MNLCVIWVGSKVRVLVKIWVMSFNGGLWVDFGGAHHHGGSIGPLHTRD